MVLTEREKKKYFINREISWLSFNERVLQEALDQRNPVLERIRFLGIFSNNMDEFFRVRVSTMKRMVQLGKKGKSLLGVGSPEEVLKEIQRIAVRMQSLHQQTYKKLVDELRDHNIYMVNEKMITQDQGEFIWNYFHQHIIQDVVPIMLHNEQEEFPYLKDKAIYFVTKLYSDDPTTKSDYALVELADELPRFIVLPKKNNNKYIILLDDVIRYCLKDIFYIYHFDHVEAYTIKLTRDAELDFDDDIFTSFIEKVSMSLERRKTGEPVRFVYDASMPEDLLGVLVRRLKLDRYDSLIPGGRYHNFKDFIDFPGIGPKSLEYKKVPALPVQHFKPFQSVLDIIKTKDIILHYPYQSFSHFIDMLREAAIDPQVREIKITLYRVAKDSKVLKTLINAARSGKRVTVVVELQARFDEKANIRWANKMQEAGVRVIFGVEGMKVHSKLTLITRINNGKTERFAYIGTGNFHEGTAKRYCDEGLFTYDERLTYEVERSFEFFDKNYKLYDYKYLVVSPFQTRKHFIKLIDNEIAIAKKRRKAHIILKLNNLVDESMINKLYEASQAGVEINLIIRGICSLIPNVEGLSENITAISIVDKYLEHSRILYFRNGGDPYFYISSADWMTRNLDRRVEVSTPIYDKEVQDELMQMLKIQLKDNTKARVIDKDQNNYYQRNTLKRKVRAQVDYYKYLKRRSKT